MSWRRFIQLLIGVLLLILVAMLVFYFFVLPKGGAGVVGTRGASGDSQWRFLFALYGPGLGDTKWFNRPLGVATDGTRLYVTDTDNGRVCVFDDQGHFQRAVGTVGLRTVRYQVNPAWKPGQLASPSDCAAAPNGTIWVADTVNRMIQRFDPNGVASMVIPTPGSSAPGTLSHATLLERPLSVTVAENSIYVADSFRVSRYSLDGQPRGYYGQRRGGKGVGQLLYPWGIVVDEAGNVAVADSLNHRVQAFTASGTPLWTAQGTQVQGRSIDPEELFALPRGMDRDAAGRLFVSDPLRSRIIVLSAAGKILAELGTTGRAQGELMFPNDVAVTKSGTVFVCDQGNSRIQAFRLNIRLP